MDPEVSPCHDFYAHACGNWSAAHEKDPYRSLLEQLDFEYQERLAKVLEGETSGKEPRFLQLPFDFYASCRRSLDIPQVLVFLKQLVTHPQLGNNELTVALTAAFRLKVLVEMGGKKMQNIWLQLLLRSIPEWNSNETSREPLQRHQFELLWLPATARGRLSTEVFWQEVSQLEEYMMQEDVVEDESADEDSLLDRQHIPAFWMLPWRRSPPSVSYIRHMAVRLSEKPPEFLIPYILLRLRLAAGAGAGAGDAEGEEVAGAKPWQVSRSECAEQTRQLLSHPSVWLLEKDQPRLPEEPMLQGIFQTLKHRFGQKLRANRNGFGRNSLKFLLSKLEHMTLRLSILPRQKSVHSLERRIERHYHDLHLNASDYFGNLLAALKHSTDQQLRLHSLLRLFLPWLGNAQTKRGQPLPVEVHGFGSFGSPFYMLTTNTLVVPLSLLGPPLYSPGQSELLTYSSVGFILGHELSHGFTPEAALFDSRGREQLGTALELVRNPRFREQGTCLRRRFGAEQLEEKFADANGLELAYSAYFDAAEGDRRWDENSIEPGPTTMLRRQHFFLNFAQFFCSDEDSSQDNDDHGTDRRRVNDAVADFEPFRQAFNCPKRWYEKYIKRTQCRLY
ncbi:hypothetical protein KR038_004968 [Drosophila bunnanda]|nr:hypothetical protein KR038_004968 [Drosophila bunnanda]